MMASKKELALTREEVLELLELRIPENDFYRRVSKGVSKAGSKAGTLNKDGYIVIMINGNNFRAHRLVWFITYGKFPDNQVDHINGNKTDNRVCNLRDVSHQINMENRPKYKRIENHLPTGVRVGYRNKLGEVVGYEAFWHTALGVKLTKYFSTHNYSTTGDTIRAASDYRQLMIDSRVEEGANYTNRHGLP